MWRQVRSKSALICRIHGAHKVADLHNPLSEQAISNLEERIPDIAQSATRIAHLRALAAGYTVLKVEGAHLVASHADGTSLVVGKTKPRRRVKFGEVLTVRRVESSTSV